MKLSFRYRFILSFVTLEILFLIMIVSINFSSIEETFNNLTDNKIEYLKSLGSKLLITPMAVYDLATIDNVMQMMVGLQGVKAAQVENIKGKIISEHGSVDLIENLIKIETNIEEDGINLGKLVFWLDFSNNFIKIKDNRTKTIYIVSSEIVISILLSFLIGNRLTRNLERLRESAEMIGEDNNVKLPDIKGSIELVELSKAMKKMQKRIADNSRRIAEQQYMVNKYVIISDTDLEGKITYVSDAFCKISGYDRDELIGKDHNILRHPDMQEKPYEDLWRKIVNGETWSGEIKNMPKNGGYFWVSANVEPIFNAEGICSGYRAIRQDITDRKQVEELSITDKLTGLYNRLKLDEVFSYEIEQSKRYKKPFSIIIIDLDKFKNVNDTFGHQIGDKVLQNLAEILKHNTRTVDTVGRWGGEEFLVICPNTDLKNTVILAEKIRKAVEGYDFEKVGKRTISLGVSTFNIGDTEENMIYRADKALYIAKDDGRNQVVVAIDEEKFKQVKEIL